MDKRITIYHGDITKMGVDAIVNAANTSLLGGGGVDGAIHLAAGPQLLAECRGLHGCAVGDAKITAGYLLPAEYVIHTVGPIWQNGKNNESAKLRSCYQKSLQLAVNSDLKTIAFPAISTGVYGYPKQQAAKVAIKAINDFLKTNTSFEKIYLVAFDKQTTEIYRNILSDLIYI